MRVSKRRELMEKSVSVSKDGNNNSGEDGISKDV
jgi:hypothetical protein